MTGLLTGVICSKAPFAKGRLSLNDLTWDAMGVAPVTWPSSSSQAESWLGGAEG